MFQSNLNPVTPGRQNLRLSKINALDGSLIFTKGSLSTGYEKTINPKGLIFNKDLRFLYALTGIKTLASDSWSA